MLRNFQPFVDFKKMIEIQANNISYRVSKKEIGNKYNDATVRRKNETKVKKMLRK